MNRRFARKSPPRCCTTASASRKTAWIPLSFHVPLVRNGFRLRLLPAGHIPGSAMLHVTRISDNASLLYTGDFKTRRSRTAEAVNFLAADTLVMETTFGLPGYEFPNPMEIEGEILRFVHDGFADGETPVLLGYSLGKAQEALALLRRTRHPRAAPSGRRRHDPRLPRMPACPACPSRSSSTATRRPATSSSPRPMP